MKIYITRHGQVSAQEYYGDVSYPAGDLPLTPLGREQAKLLGEHLKSLGFRGRIVASPYRRTAETADIIASTLGLGVTLLPCLREIMKTEAAARSFRGMTLAELHAAFPTTCETAALPFPWWTAEADTSAVVAERVCAGLDAFLPTVAEGEVLLIGHGATVTAMQRKYFGIERKRHRRSTNCCLSFLDTETGEEYGFDTDFLPKTHITVNGLTYAEICENNNISIKNAADFAKKHTNSKLLHIGDTPSFSYDFYQKLISAVKPSIILHTGDFADEYKAGRREIDVSEWLRSASDMVEILRGSGAQIIAVPGNNDPEPLLRSLAPDFAIAARNDVISLGCRRACLCHEPAQIAAEADDYFYGHTLNEPRTQDANELDGKRYFNCMWGSSIHDLESGEYLFVPNPVY